MAPRVAAITMAYNEPDYLPIWQRHYATQLGAEHCYLVDHGSDDGSTDSLGGVNRIRIPRSAQDDPKRARFISGIAAALLEWYDWVLYSDVDELVVADPARYAGIPAWCASAQAETGHAIGLDLHQVPDLEAPIDPARPVLQQRRWARFSSAMCKLVLLRRPAAWAPGFHCAGGVPVEFDGLFLFHLRYYDRARGAARLAKTRAMPWAIEGAGSHQRMSDQDWLAMFDAIAALPRREDVAFDPAEPPLSDWLGRLKASMQGRENETYRFDLHISADSLWAVPDRFRGIF
jgi:hypothetical protein